MRKWAEDPSRWTPIARFHFGGEKYEVFRADCDRAIAEEWRAKRDQLSSLGFSLVQERDGKLAVHHWRRVSAAAERRILAMSEARSSDFQAPSPPGFNFYKYQLAGIEFAWERRCVLIGDEMGLGKTPQALGLSNLIAEKEGLSSFLIVTLASLKINWKREAKRWLTYDHELVVAEGSPPPSLDSLFTQPKARVLIINYDLLHRWEKLLIGTPWDLYVADEAHEMRNPRTKSGRVGLAIGARRKAFLTGTPIDNRPADFFFLLNTLQSSAFPNFHEFAKRYCDAKWKEIFTSQRDANGRPLVRKIFDTSGASNLSELREKLRSTVMIRRLKKDVADELPKKYRQIVELPATLGCEDDRLGLFSNSEAILGSVQEAINAAELTEDRNGFKKAIDRRALKQIKVLFKETAEYRKRAGIAKIPLVIAHLKKLIAEGNKVICFAHHHEVLDRIYEEFKEQAVLVRGGKSGRQKNIDRFQNDQSCRLAVAGIHAAGTGLNLTEANFVVFAELDFVPGTLQQCEDRAHRHGQTKTVHVQYLVLEGTLDARMIRLLVRKMNISDAALDDKEEKPEEVSHPELERQVEAGITSDALAKEGSELSAARRRAIHSAIKNIAKACDFGRKFDGVGFNVLDAPIGHDLAACKTLSPAQAALGLRLVRRYHRQVSSDLMQKILPEVETIEKPIQGCFDFDLPMSA